MKLNIMKGARAVFPENKRGRHWASTRCLNFSASPIGKGGLSVVYRATDLATGREYAVKKIDLAKLSAADEENVRRELDAYFTLSHRHIIRFYDYLIERNVMFIVLELAKESLYSYMHSKVPMEEREIRRIFGQCVEVFSYIHSKGFLVRDIKPENILIDSNGDVKVCDFGWSCRLVGCRDRTGKSGTYPYMSPESLKGQLQDTPSDVWSLGVLLYEMHFYREPYPGRSEEEMLRLIHTSKPTFKFRGLPVSSEAVELIRSMLELAPQNRITLREAALHSFFYSPTNASITTGDTSNYSNESARVYNDAPENLNQLQKRLNQALKGIDANRPKLSSLSNNAPVQKQNTYNMPSSANRFLQPVNPQAKQYHASLEKNNLNVQISPKIFHPKTQAFPQYPEYRSGSTELQKTLRKPTTGNAYNLFDHTTSRHPVHQQNQSSHKALRMFLNI